MNHGGGLPTIAPTQEKEEGEKSDTKSLRQEIK